MVNHAFPQCAGIKASATEAEIDCAIEVARVDVLPRSLASLGMTIGEYAGMKASVTEAKPGCAIEVARADVLPRSLALLGMTIGKGAG